MCGIRQVKLLMKIPLSTYKIRRGVFYLIYINQWIVEYTDIHVRGAVVDLSEYIIGNIIF